MCRKCLLDPKTDFIFKLIFGNEKHPEILISFLNAVIKPENLITTVKIKNTDLEKKHVEDKFSHLDVKATTSNGEVVNIEIQLKDERNMIKRSLYYLSKMYEEQLVEGDNYRKLSRTIAINILRFNYLKDEESFHNAYRFKNVVNNRQLTDVMELHFIELPKFDEEVEGPKLLEDPEHIDMLKTWALFLKRPEHQNVRSLEDQVEVLREAKKELTVISADEKNRDLYEMRQASLHDRVSALEGAEEKGIKIGLKMAQEKIEAERKKKEQATVQAEQATVQAEQAKVQAEQAKVQAEQVQQKAIKALENQGLSKDQISQMLGVPISDIED